MKKLYKKECNQKGMWKNIFAFLLAAVLVFGAMLQFPVTAEAASCKSLGKAALEATGGSSQLKYQTTKADEFGGFSISEAEKVSSIIYLCDDKEIYSLCVAKASSTANADTLFKSLKAYKKHNSGSDYLSDYSSTEQKVFKNALCGKKGKYVWYIAMSSNKSVNKKGQTALKKQL